MKLKSLPFTFVVALLLAPCSLMATSNQTATKSPEVRVVHPVNKTLTDTKKELTVYHIVVQHNGKDIINQDVLLHGLVAVDIIQEEGTSSHEVKDSQK